MSQQTSSWGIDEPILLPGERGTFDDVAVKDPSIVFYEEKWHLFYTAVGQGHATTGYVSAGALADLQAAKRFQLTQLHGSRSPYSCAPQVFYFGPQETWYLILQTLDSNYQPAYSTTSTIHKPESWSRPATLVRKDEEAKWIDFWIICDDTAAYFFYTRSHREVLVMTTSIENFPQGFGAARRVLSGVHEAVHVHRAEGCDEYHMIYELNREGLRSFGLAVAKHLLGPWNKVTDEYATGDQLRSDNNRAKWTEEVSHGEVIRSGYDQRLEYDPEKTEILIQGLPGSQHQGPYSSLPWRLGVIKQRTQKHG